MSRWGLVTLTHKKRKRSESKNVNVKFQDLVKRNYNPKKDNIIATDVSYIPSLSGENNIYLSVAISHKTKMIESWKLSKINDSRLVLDTLTKLKRSNFISHSDHGTQYSLNEVFEKLKSMNAITSMGRVGNCLDNREVEYFFGCLKGEYLNRIKTSVMNINQIQKHISWYIN